MDKYKYFVRIEELKTLLRQGKNEEALEIADGMDPKKIKDNCDCMVLAEAFLNTGMLGKAKECYTVVYNRKKSRRVAMELVNICIRMKKADEAQNYYEDYKRMAPNDYFNHIFKYKIDKLRGKALREQAQDLEMLKQQEFFDNWGYELAKIYHKMGEVDKCQSVCEDVIVWFGDGEWVEKAKTLKAYCLGEISLKELSTGKSEKANISETPSDTSASQLQQNLPEGKNDVDAGEEVLERENIVPEIKEDIEYTDTVEEVTLDEENYETEINNEPMSNEAEIINQEEIPDGEIKSEEEIELEEGIESDEEIKPDDNSILSKEKSDENYLDEDEDVKIYGAAEKEGKYENDFFTDEIAKAVEEALKEESAEIREKEENNNPIDATRVWRKEDITKASSGGEKPDNKADNLEANEIQEVKSAEKGLSSANEPEIQSGQKEDFVTDQSDRTESNEKDIISSKKSVNDSINSETKSETSEVNSKLMEAVERELGFVESDRDELKEDSKNTKKSWRERWREKHQEKERKKNEQKEQEQREELRKIRELELEKQRFIESEKRKDKIKYLEHQKQISKLSNEKAKAAQLAEEQEALKRNQTAKANEPDIQDEKNAEDEDFLKDFFVDTKDIQQESDKRVVTGETYTPKALPCIDIPGNSIASQYLAKTGKTLEYYFGFFACQKNIGTQILRCMERLLDSNEEYMSYAIIGERGTGKKALVHGFAKFLSECGKLASSQIIWTESEKINSTDLREKADKLKGRCLAIDRAGGLDDEGLMSVCDVVRKNGKKSLFVIADYRRNMVELFNREESFEDLFGYRISIPAFSQEDLYDYIDYKVGTAGFIFSSEAYELILRRIKGIMRATEEGALARTEKYILKTLDNAEQRNGEAYIRQTLEHEKHVRSNVIIPKDLPESI